MAKLKVFVSSTYYDLKHVRASLEVFIKTMGYDSVLYESGDIGFLPDDKLDEACYKEINNAHMQVLIIGGRYGSPASIQPETPDEREAQYKKFNSVTKVEFTTALELQIPIYFFVEEGVLAEYTTYKKNRDNTSIQYAHVDSVNIFTLLDDIHELKQGNYIQGFSRFEDIAQGLKSQWGHLFADLLVNRKSQIELNTLSSSLTQLNSVTSSLKTYTEAILQKIEPEKFPEIKRGEDEKMDTLKTSALHSNAYLKAISGLSKAPLQTIISLIASTNDYYEFAEEVNKLSDKQILTTSFSQAPQLYNKTKDLVK